MTGSGSSLASELAAKLSRQVDAYAASLAQLDASGSEGEAASPGEPEDDEEEEPNEQAQDSTRKRDKAASAAHLASLSAALARVRHFHSSPSSLESVKSRIDDAARSRAYTVSAQDVSNTSGSSKEQADQLQWLINAHLTVNAWGAVLASLLSQAEKVKDEEAYWQSVVGQDASGLLYLVQTMPLRIANALRVLYQRLQIIARSPRPPKSLLSVKAVKRALPPSLLITSLFPHLSTSSSSNEPASSSVQPQRSARSLLFLTFSPLLLTRQEVSLKQKKLEKMRKDLAKRIGGFVRDADKALSDLQASSSSGDLGRLGDVMGERITFLEASLAEPPKEGEEARTQDPIQPLHPSDLIACIQQTMHRSSSLDQDKFSSQLTKLSRPGWITRTWPYLVSTPLIGWIIANKVYKSRQSIADYYSLAKETVRGFFVDWVIDPCVKIFATLRHGDDTMALMGRESLKSDFDASATATADVLREALRQNLRLALYMQSLERMVEQFAKDLKMPADQIARVVQRVREGDMSLVLGAYEQELKNPLKNAIAGNLVRTLLIQVQKVKVDVDLAMDGIEKVLKSQQLTFAFVGVAPSLILLAGLGAVLRRSLQTGPSKGSKEMRRRVWYTMRNIDRILTAALDTTDVPKALDDTSMGLLLIELTTLRDYVHSSAFPTRDRGIKAAFLDDVRDLEKARLGLEAKLRVYDRLSRMMRDYLRT